MSLTAILWLSLFVAFAALVLHRSSWAIPLYMLTFYAHPPGWWWGRGALTTIGIRWNLVAALIFAVGVLLDLRRNPEDAQGATRRVLKLLLLYAIVASAVHFLLVRGPSADIHRSYEGLVLLWKQFGLLFLMCLAVRDEFDLKLLIYSLVVGAGYIGYEVVVNNRGHFEGSRLEGIQIAGAAESNYMAGLLCLSLVMGGCLLLIGKRREKIVALLLLPLIFDVILRCNSRGAFLALIVAGAWLVIRSRARIRRYALAAIALGGLAAFVQIGDQRIIDRFMSTFVSAEERDVSAQSRITLWREAVKMIGDYPLGSGAEAAFKSHRGVHYLYDIGIPGTKAVHNGYLDIAASWGLQGLIIYLAAIFFAWLYLRAAIVQVHSRGDERIAFLGVCIEAALITQLGACMFISSLDGEWFYWWIAMALGYHRIFAGDVVDDSGDNGEEAEDQLESQPDEGTPYEMASV